MNFLNCLVAVSLLVGLVVVEWRDVAIGHPIHLIIHPSVILILSILKLKLLLLLLLHKLLLVLNILLKLHLLLKLIKLRLHIILSTVRNIHVGLWHELLLLIWHELLLGWHQELWLKSLLVKLVILRLLETHWVLIWWSVVHLRKLLWVWDITVLNTLHSTWDLSLNLF